MSQGIVYKALSEKKWMTSDEIAIKAKINRSRVISALQRLLRHGEARHKTVRGRYQCHYYLKVPME